MSKSRFGLMSRVVFSWLLCTVAFAQFSHAVIVFDVNFNREFGGCDVKDPAPTEEEKFFGCGNGETHLKTVNWRDVSLSNVRISGNRLFLTVGARARCNPFFVYQTTKMNIKLGFINQTVTNVNQAHVHGEGCVVAPLKTLEIALPTAMQATVKKVDGAHLLMKLEPSVVNDLLLRISADMTAALAGEPSGSLTGLSCDNFQGADPAGFYHTLKCMAFDSAKFAAGVVRLMRPYLESEIPSTSESDLSRISSEVWERTTLSLEEGTESYIGMIMRRGN